jgi:hypothetical protein
VVHVFYAMDFDPEIVGCQKYGHGHGGIRIYIGSRRRKPGDKTHEVTKEYENKYRTYERKKRFAPMGTDILIHQFINRLAIVSIIFWIPLGTNCREPLTIKAVTINIIDARIA